MPILTEQQVRSHASRAGFSGRALDTIVAIARAESGFNTSAQGRNTDGSIDRGLVQINNRWHPEVSDSCAYDPACSMTQAYRISSRGTNFGTWTTYTSGRYRQYLTAGTSGNSNLKSWYDYPISQPFHAGHDGIDFAVPMGTPLFFLESGTISTADYQDWGGQVFLSQDDGGIEFHYHLDDIVVRPGQHVAAGQLIGYSGGQTSGGKHPTKPQWSTGPHTHYGVRNPVTDPAQLVSRARSAGVRLNQMLTDISNGTRDFLNEMPGFTGIVLNLDAAEHMPGLIWESTDPIGSILKTLVGNAMGFIVRSFFVLVGLLILAGLIYNLVQKGGEENDQGEPV